MPFNFYDTHTLLMAVQQLTPAATFLRDRYFPTNDASDIFATDDVLVEFRDGSKKLAPFVAPRKGGVTVLRAGYNMERYTPPFVAPRRVLTLDELRKRGFGEALYSQLTPEQRQQTLILRDADELGELITNREEAMAAETMLTNGCVMKHIADDVDKADEMEIRFYSEASNPATYTPTAKWDATGGKILKDLEAMIRMLTKRGLRASDLVCSPDVADTIINDAAVQKLLDNRRIEIGNVEPELLPVNRFLQIDHIPHNKNRRRLNGRFFCSLGNPAKICCYTALSGSCSRSDNRCRCPGIFALFNQLITDLSQP